MAKQIFLTLLALVSIIKAEAQFMNKVYDDIPSALQIAGFDSTMNVYVHTWSPSNIFKTDSTNQNVQWQNHIEDNSIYLVSKIFGTNIYTVSNVMSDPYNYVILSKLKLDGTIIWSKSLRAQTSLLILSVVVENTSNDIFLGFGACGYSNAIVKLDADGNFIWCKSYNPYSGFGGAVRDLEDDGQGNILVLSHCQLTPFNKRVPLLFKIDNSGNVIWCKLFPSFVYNGDRISNLTIDSQRNIYFTNDLYSTSQINKNSIYKTDSLGEVQWVKYYTYPLSQNSITLGLDVDTNNKLYSIGNGIDTLGPYHNANLIKINALSGDVLNSWIDTSSAFDIFIPMSIKCVNPNKIVMAGYKNGSRPAIASVDSLANGICSYFPTNVIDQTFEAYDSTAALAIYNLSPMIADTTILVNPINETSSEFCASNVAIQSPDYSDDWAVYPNPFSAELIFNCFNEERTELIFYDLTGRIISRQTFTGEYHMNTSQLTNGVYFYELKSVTDKSQIRKVVKQ